MKTRERITLRQRPNSESGQATTEFALILVPLLLLVAGIIQFGIALNFWLDEQRIANQGARFAAVNAWPGCARSAAAGSCNQAPACTVSPPANTTLANWVKCQAISEGLRNNVVVTVCYPNDGDSTNDGRVGSPVRVNVATQFNFLPIVNLGTITLNGRATMRLEQDTNPSLPPPSLGHLSGVTACP